jgi:cellulose synthase/poly-beta-1,6-N-acetylglucosamine synthase-like glycosyltransferase
MAKMFIDVGGERTVGHPKVSVLIPCYNAEKYIGETLESVLRQTWPAIEVIVVNDGSVDGSAAVVRSFARQNLRLVEQENRGQTAALRPLAASRNSVSGRAHPYVQAAPACGLSRVACSGELVLRVQ